MTRIAIILNQDGVFESALSDSEVDVVVLKKGVNDREIDKAESELAEIET